MRSQARDHDVSEIFDHTYKPVDITDIELFSRKQSFMYTVFIRSLMTDMGKTIVRKYESSFNSQMVYKELCEYAKTSTAARLKREEIIKFLTVDRLDSRWSGSTTGFLLHWNDRMRHYESLSPTDQFYTDGSKRTMLEHAVRNIAELNSVQLIAEQSYTLHGVQLSYQKYFELLMTAATRRDNQLRTPPQRSRRNVFNNELEYSIDNDNYYREHTVDYSGMVHDVDNLDINDDDNAYSTREANVNATEQSAPVGYILARGLEPIE